MFKKCFFFFSLILFCSQSSLHAAASARQFAFSVPGERLHEKLCKDIGVPEDRTVAKIPSKMFFEKIIAAEESNDFSEVLVYLQVGRGNQDRPYELAVLPLPPRFGKSRANEGETTVFDIMSPLCAAISNSRACYLQAACAIAKEFPYMIDSKVLGSFVSLELHANSDGLYEVCRAFLNFFIPYAKKPNFSDYTPFIDAKDPRFIVALYARGLRFDATAYNHSTEYLKLKKFNKIQLKTLELIAQEDEKLREILLILRDEHAFVQKLVITHDRHCLDKQEPSADLPAQVARWLQEERDHLRDKGFDLPK